MKKISDPTFGDLYYQDVTEEDVSKIHEVTAGIQGRVCPEPFRKIMVLQNGDVIICCPQWLPAVIGNVLTNTIQDIWAGEKANIIRQTMLDGSYKYCDKKVCHFMHNAKKAFHIKETFDPSVNPLPTEINISVDGTCNLFCPSCRTEKITFLNTQRKQAADIISSVLDSLFSEPHNERVDLEIDGIGDIFSSSIYRHEFETRKCFINPELWPNLQYTLLTNGVLMTEKIQNKHSTLFAQTKIVKISIDAGNEQSYDKVRLGGNWTTLWKNLDYLYESRLKRPDNTVDWAWIVVLQEDNFESVPELIKLAYNYPDNLPMIHLHPILQGNHMPDFIFRDKAVWLETSPRYARLQEVLALPAVTNYPKLFKPF
jgi:sulfatase maturation enzyme AslB (radical SAM superfamily)